ncbi:forkhead-associated domain-containing protein 1 isoform X2 [Macrotis lagotis]|uniref:forkhead-associated domain-containing protein 1 isoform X2 n=1 Tax=Macrotis lagotis TaxID=92651 RepID=UPI003D69E16A
MESGVHRTAARGDPGWSPASEPEQRPPARLPSSSLRRAGRLLQPRRTAIMKAFLKCSEGFIFLRRYTTIGRHENSDIVLKYPDIDNHHALIEFNEEEGTFILQDFNSLSGTFVNNCHIQNVAVKLKPGDVLRFGSGGLTYELVVEFLTSGRYSSWSRTVNADQIPSFSTQLPVLYHQPISAHRSWSQGLMEGTQPRPPVEKRPISASGRKMLTVSSDPIDKFPVKQVWTAGDSIWSPDEVFCNLDQHSIMPHKKGQVMHLNQSHLFNLPHLEQSHFINISHLDRSHRPSFPQVEQTQLVTIANELNTQDDIIQHLEQEVNRLSSFEMESKHKDAVIANLQNEVATMSQKLMLTQTTPKQSHVKMGQKCAQLKEDLKKDELEAKEKELKSCKSQIKDLEQQMKTLGEQLQKSFNEHNLISKMLREKSKLEHFRNQIIEAIYGRGKLPQSRIVTNQQLVETVSHVIEDNFHLQQKKIIMNKNHSINATKDEFLVQMDKLKAFLEDCQTCLKLSCCGNDLRKQLGDFQNFPVDASVKWLHKIIVEILQMVVCWVEKFEQLLKDVGIELAHSDKGLSLYLSKFLENHKKIANRNQELQTKLSNLQEIHHSLVQKLQGQALEHERQIKEQIKLMQEKQEEENRVWKNSLTQEKIQAKAAVEEEKKKVQDLENHLRKLKKEMESKSQEESQQTNTKDQKDKESLTLSLNKALEELSEARKKQILLGEQLLKHQDTLKAVQEEKNLEKRILEMEIVQYKEQVKQHSQTIVALEERLQQVTQQNKDIEQKIVSLKENIPGTSSYWRKNTSEKVQKELQKGPLRKTLATGKSHDPLLEEFMVVQKQLISQHELTNNLKTDLSKSQTKISTLKKEFDEQRKAEVGQKLLIQQQKKELKEVKEKLIQMSNLTDQKNKEIESLKAQQRSSTPVETKKVCTMCDVEIQVDNDPDVFIFNQEASSFIELGTKCKGHRHEEVIQRQKNALAELRGQIKELSPNVRDAGMESLLESKKSKLGKSIRIIEKESTLPNIDLKVGNKPIQSLFPSRLFNTPAERAAKLDLIEALDLSEKLYMDLTKTLSSLMSIKDMPGNLSMKHLSQKEREKINQLRRKDLDLVFVKISQLKNRLERKEDLLREYEKDNESLRQSKIPMQVYQAQMGKLEDEIYKEVEEKALLKEALERTENQLNLERKMNRSIKQQKERFDEQEQKNSKEIPISNCLQKDRHERLKAKKITLKTDQERNLQNKELPSKAIL